MEEKEGGCSKVHLSGQGCGMYSLIPSDGHFIIYKSAAFRTISLFVFCLCLSYLSINVESTKLIVRKILLLRL